MSAAEYRQVLIDLGLLRPAAQVPDRFGAGKPFLPLDDIGKAAAAGGAPRKRAEAG